MPIPKHPFIYVRHGQTDWNVEGRLQGHSDTPLNAEGIRQASVICEKLLADKVDYIISSPLIRALKTAAFIAETHQKPVHIESRLKERTFGSFEGRITAEVKRELGISPETSITTVMPPDAEQWPETTARILDGIGDWLTKHPKSNLVFVSHAAMFRALVEALTGTRMEAKNATPYQFTPTDTGWEITPL